MRIPLYKPKSVVHIGSMDARHKGRFFTDSLEGHCLSVSTCPAAWCSIAKLGGMPWWRLSKGGAIFVDVLKVYRSKSLCRQIEEWGLEHNLVEKHLMWRAWDYDSEGGDDGDWRYMLFPSEQEALDQLECDEDELVTGRDGKPMVDSTEVFTGTDLMAARLGMGKLSKNDCFDFLIMLWAQDTRQDVDGVWWHETLDPFVLSAPRGGIFPNKVKEWSICRMPAQ